MKQIIKHTLFFTCTCLLMGTLYAQKDKYAEIGGRKYDVRAHLLMEPQPAVLTDLALSTSHNPQAAFKVQKPISTKKELYAEVEKLRKVYEPFMQNIAPSIADTRKRIPLNNFQWRIETENDLLHFSQTLTGKGNWQTVSIPHYGPPLGRAVTYYYKELDIAAPLLSGKEQFICFKGVDYKATVYLNDRSIGSHEGFFSPFEFNISKELQPGKNRLLIKVENDFATVGGKDDKGNHVIGDKIYSGAGPGYNDPELGWHLCPPAMGIYQDCFLETRDALHINDLYVRPMPKSNEAEVWVEVNNFHQYPKNVKLNISIFGQNFSDTLVYNLTYIPSTTFIPGVGDLVKPTDWQKSALPMGYGVNFLRIPISLKKYRIWKPETPWLYQVQVSVLDDNEKITDTRSQQFGMRSFEMDTINIPKGKLLLNGEMIRLRGANSMGFEQQDVIKGDTNQLITDILLAKLCNLNFIRFTQRPVQKEVYEICDKLGMLNQTDLPLFGTLRRNQFAQAVKQAEEMERLIRPHPSAIITTYINERFPNAEGNPQRSFNTAEEYYRLFSALDQSVLLSNPDRVIKAGDGDYDPPSPGIPDNHCYNTWYNGHGLGLGKMYKGYWQLVKPDWYYACGEFGAEGLDPLNVMQKYYPTGWLPKSKEDEKSWTAKRISLSQTNQFHYMWYNTQHSLQDWIDASQEYQAWAMKFVAESFRRDSRMISFAVHLFIDAWPAGWMKSIMDVDRQPKKAYFAYRNALAPLLVSLRSDRNNFFAGETTSFETWVCNDLNAASKTYSLHYQIEQDGKIIMANKVPANITINSSQFQGHLKFKTPDVKTRTKYIWRAALINEKGESVNQNEFEFEVHPSIQSASKKLYIIGDSKGKAMQIASQAGYSTTALPKDADAILVDDFSAYLKVEKEINKLVMQGKKLVFLELPAKQYQIAQTEVTIDKTTMGDYYFASPATGHSLVKKYQPFDFNLWYDGKEKCIMPLLAHTITAPGWESIMSSGNSNWLADKGAVMAVSQLVYGKGVIRICELQLNNRINYNPAAAEFLNDLIKD